MKKYLLPLINISFLVVALLGIMPYGFYNLLKIVIFTSSLFYIVRFYDFDKSFLMWIAVFHAIIYNPLFPIGLGRDIWVFVNILSIFFFVRTMFYRFTKLGLKVPDVNIEVKVEAPEISDEIKKRLYEELRSWRLKKAKENKVSAFIVFNNSTFNEIVRNISYFKTKDQLMKISGIGKIKYQIYSDEIWSIMSKYIKV
jgi:hypothetical protein